MASSNTTTLFTDQGILCSIFQQLAARHDFKTLANCMLVNSSWIKEARLALYYQLGHNDKDEQAALRRGVTLGPGIYDLLGTPGSLKRLQIYAQSVRCVKLTTVPRNAEQLHSDQLHHFLKVLDFSRVREVEISNLLHWQSYPSYCPSFIGENVTKLMVGSKELKPWAFQMIKDKCPRLIHLEIGSDDEDEVSFLLNESSDALAVAVTSLSLLKTLSLRNVACVEQGSALFNVVARHRSLQSVDGVTIKGSWIEALRRQRDGTPWFASIRHIGISTSIFGLSNELDLDELNLEEHVNSLYFMGDMIPNLVSIQVESRNEAVIKMLTTLDKVQEVTIISKWRDEHDATMTATETLRCFLPMKNLRVLKFPEFHRCRKLTISADKVFLGISWKDVEVFIKQMPNLEELSFCSMHLHGFTLGNALCQFDYTPVTWRRNHGWEILEWGRASGAFKNAMAGYGVGKFMPHNFFGPYRAGDNSMLQYVPNNTPSRSIDNAGA